MQVDVRFGRGVLAAGARISIQEAARGTAFRFAGFSDSQGRLTILNVPVGAFVVRSEHPLDNRFAGESSGELVSDGQAVPIAVVLPGMGEVTGRVTNQDGTPAVDVLVSLRSTHPTLGGFFNTRTDNDGVYRQGRMAIGPVSATVFDQVRQLFGEAFAAIDTDGQVVGGGHSPDEQRGRSAGVPLRRQQLPLRHRDARRHRDRIQLTCSPPTPAASAARWCSTSSTRARAHRFTGSSIGTVEQDGPGDCRSPAESRRRRRDPQGLRAARRLLRALSGHANEPVAANQSRWTCAFRAARYAATTTRRRAAATPITGHRSLRTSSGDTTLDVSSCRPRPIAG